MKTSTLMALGAAALLLVACGGGGSDPVPSATESVPDEASASAVGMADWLGQVAATAPEDREPIDVARFAPPQNDETEPETLR